MHIHGIASFNTHKYHKMGIPNMSEVCVLIQLLTLTFIKIAIWGYPVRCMHIHGIVKFNIHKNSNLGIPSQKYAYS